MNKLFVVFLVILMSGCSIRPHVKTEQPFTKSLRGYSSAAVSITAKPEISNNTDYDKVKANLLNAIATKINPRTGLIYVLDGSADLSINVEVRHFIYTSQAARIMFGIMSGTALLATDVKLIDNKTHEVLWKVQTDVSSTASEGVFGGSSTTQIETLSTLIITQMQSKL